MRTRGVHPKFPPDQDTLHWASWHRMHAWDPQWAQHVIIVNGPTDHSYSWWSSWEQADERWNVSVIDTTDAKIDLMLDTVAEWVKSEREKTPLLTPETKWWKNSPSNLWNMVLTTAPVNTMHLLDSSG